MSRTFRFNRMRDWLRWKTEWMDYDFLESFWYKQTGKILYDRNKEIGIGKEMLKENTTKTRRRKEKQILHNILFEKSDSDNCVFPEKYELDDYWNYD